MRSFRSGRPAGLAAAAVATAVTAGLLVTAAVATAVTAGLLVTGAHDAYPTTRVVQDSGLVWVTSDQIGSLTLLDGIAGQPVVNVRVTRATGDPLQAGQAGTTGFALDTATGQLTRIDGSSYATRSTQVPLSSTAVEFLAGPHAADVVESNTASAYDPVTLQPVNESRLFAQGLSDDTAVVDSSSRLWVLNSGSGRLAWYTGTAAGLSPHTFTPGSALVLADGEPVVADTGSGRAYLIGPGGSATASLALGAFSGAAVVSGATAFSGLVVTDSFQGSYQICTFALGRCATSYGAGFRGHILGPAITADDRIFVPDYTSGTVWVLDPGGRAPVDTTVLTAAGPFDLFDRDGLVFYNDPQTSQAGTIAANGTPSPIVKYSAPVTSGPPSPSASATPAPSRTPSVTSPPTPHPSGPVTPTPSPTPTPTPRGSTGPCSPGALPGSALSADSSQTPALTLTDPESTGVYGIAYAPNGTLAVGDLNGSAYLWNVAARKVMGYFPGSSAREIFGLALSPDDRILAVNTLDHHGQIYFNTGIVLWSTASCRQLAILNDPDSDGVGNPVVFSPDGGTLAAADANGCVYLWSTTSYQRIHTLCDPGPGGHLDYGIAFSPTTGLLAAADVDGYTYLWDTRSRIVVRKIAEPGGAAVKSVAFGSDGTLATGDNNGNVNLWDAATGAHMATLDGIPGAIVHSIAFSPRADIVAATVNDKAGSRYEVYVWNTSGKVLDTFRCPASAGGTMLAFSPDGDYLAVGDENAHTYLWDVSQLGG